MHFHPKEWSWINHTFSRMTFFVPASFLPLCSCHHQPIKSWIGPGFTPRPWDWGRVNGCEQTPKHWLLMKADSRLSMWIIFFLNNTKPLENVWVYLHTSLIWSINWLYFCSLTDTSDVLVKNPVYIQTDRGRKSCFAEMIKLRHVAKTVSNNTCDMQSFVHLQELFHPNRGGSGTYPGNTEHKEGEFTLNRTHTHTYGPCTIDNLLTCMFLHSWRKLEETHMNMQTWETAHRQ